MLRPLYIVSHIPKTAGSTLRCNFELNFTGPTWLPADVPGTLEWDEVMGDKSPLELKAFIDGQMYGAFQDRTECIFGHWAYYGIHRAVPHPLRRGVDARYITFLRDPVARVVSMYRYNARTVRTSSHQEIQENEWSLDEWFERSSNPRRRNGQVRHLLLGSHPDIMTRAELTREHLEIAKRRLKKFWFVGLTERFEEDAAHLYGRLHFNNFLPTEFVNASDGEFKANRAEIQAVTKGNELDIELYEFARSLAKKTVATAPDRPEAIQRYLRVRGWNDLRLKTIGRAKNLIFRSSPSKAPEGEVSRDIILTGIPRSGTTLTCYLLNTLPDHVALHEPISPEILGGLTKGSQVVEAAEDFFEEARKSLIERGVALSRHVDGKIPDSHVPETAGDGGLRQDPASWGEVAVGKSLTPDFSLFVKHPVPFTGALSSLVKHYPCYALVRNPLGVLGSWNSVNMYFRTGRAYGAERLDPKLARLQEKTTDEHQRQIQLLNWFYERYLEFLPASSVLRYEAIVESGGSVLSAVTTPAAQLNEPLASKNASKAYPKEDLLVLGEKLLASQGACWEFYSRTEVEELLESWRLEKLPA